MRDASPTSTPSIQSAAALYGVEYNGLSLAHARRRKWGGIGDLPAIPEPETCALMLGGLAAGLAFLGGRRLQMRARNAN